MQIAERVAICAMVGTLVALKVAAPDTIAQVLAAKDDPTTTALRIAAISTAAALAVFYLLE